MSETQNERPAYHCTECGAMWNSAMNRLEPGSAPQCGGSIQPFVVERFRSDQIGKTTSEGASNAR